MSSSVELRGKDEALLRCAQYEAAERRAVLSFLDDIGVEEDVTPHFREIMLALRVPEGLLDAYCRGFDEDGDGLVTRREFLLGIAAMDPETPHGTAALFKRLQSTFAMFDHNRSRALDLDKLVALFEHLEEVSGEHSGDPAELALQALGQDPLAELSITQFVQQVVNGEIKHTEKVFRLSPESDLAVAREQIQSSPESLLAAAGYGTEERQWVYSQFFASCAHEPPSYYLKEDNFERCLASLSPGNSCGLSTAQLYKALDKQGDGRLEVMEFLSGLASMEPPPPQSSQAQRLLLCRRRAELLFRGFASPLNEMAQPELTKLLRAVHEHEHGVGVEASEEALHARSLSVLQGSLVLSQDTFVERVLQGELAGLSLLTRFSLGSPVKSTPGGKLAPEVKWHRTMKIAIDRAPLLTPGLAKPTGGKSTGLRLERTESVSTVVAQEARIVEIEPTACMTRPTDQDSVHMRVLRVLLKPHEWTPPSSREFGFSVEDIEELCSTAAALVKEEPHIVELEAPVRVFGDIHGQFGDLMSYFGRLGTPADWLPAGDIHFIQYLFLGDYVDRGRHSLEVAMLLLALKVKFPLRVFLIRGNHEDRDINARDGFLFECLERLGTEHAERAFDAFNSAFSWLPVAASIEGAIFCVHGGPGRLETLEEVRGLPRGTTNVESKALCGEMLNDLLWSDPTEHDSIEGIVPNPQRGSVFYGPDVVSSFLARNGFGPEGRGMLVRAHECTTDGFDLHTGGRCVTVFSATNYCGVYQNTGAVLEVFWDHTPGAHQLLVQAKLIGPGVGTSESWQEIADCPPTPPRHWADVYEQFEEIQGRVQEEMQQGIQRHEEMLQEGQVLGKTPRPPTPLRRSNKSSGDLFALFEPAGAEAEAAPGEQEAEI